MLNKYWLDQGSIKDNSHYLAITLTFKYTSATRVFNEYLSGSKQWTEDVWSYLLESNQMGRRLSCLVRLRSSWVLRVSAYHEYRITLPSTPTLERHTQKKPCLFSLSFSLLLSFRPINDIEIRTVQIPYFIQWIWFNQITPPLHQISLNDSIGMGRRRRWIWPNSALHQYL